MNRSSPFNFALAIIVGIASGLGAGMPMSSNADDTEVYLGATVITEGLRPNVLFILDTSGSMSATVKGTGMDRLDNMKVAMKKILDGANNVNVGLMRFTDPGGPILFPVRYIDEDASIVTEDGDSEHNDTDVNVQIDQSSDDAEEYWPPDAGMFGGGYDSAGNVGKMELDSPVLDVVKLAASAAAGGNNFEMRVEDKNDDAEQYEGGGMVIDGSRLGMGYDDSRQQLVGYRFRGVEVPKDATILSAELVFTNKEDASGSGFTLRITGEADDTPKPFDGSDPDNISSRPRVADSGGSTVYVDWVDPEGWWNDNKDYYASPDISSIVQEIVKRPDWDWNDSMVFIVENAPGSDGSSSKVRNARSRDDSSSRATALRITWTTEVNPAGVQRVGLRFRNVGVPRGAKIERAVIEFRPDSDSASDALVRVWGEDIGNAATFTNTDNNITSRNRTLASLPLLIEPWEWEVGTAFQTKQNSGGYSDDLTAIVQEIVDRPDWCGNNAMGFIIEAEDDASNLGPLVGNSFDSDPTNAPILRIEYDESTVPTNACIDQWVQRQIVDGNDDAEEVVDKGTIELSSSDLDFDDEKMSGMRFQGLPINKGQTILEARLVFQARETQTGPASYDFWGHIHPDSPQFEDNSKDISKRKQTTATVNWKPTDHTAGGIYQTPDLKSLVQEIVNQATWEPGNAIVLLQEYGSGSDRVLKSFEDGGTGAPILKIKVQGALAKGGKSGVKTVRDVMKEIIDNLDHEGNTPVVDTLYEAARYFRGDRVLYGQYRGWEREDNYDQPLHPGDGNKLNPKPNSKDNNDDVRRNTRVSHPASWSDGKIVRKGDCDEEDLNNKDCIEEYIDDKPTYVSPIISNCQSNYIILMTDGEANHNHSDKAIRDYIGGGLTCPTGNDDERCGHELVEWLHDEDQIKGVDGDQHVFTYTIGFNFSSDWLKDMAAKGGGSFYEASTADELVRQITQIFADIMNRSTSFAAPTLSINTFDRLRHREDVYFSLFRPSPSKSWTGNVKKYSLCQSSADCVLGEAIDANGNGAIDQDPLSEGYKRIKPSALSYWTDGDDYEGSGDGDVVREGGAGRELPPPDKRTLYTYSDLDNDPDWTPLNVAEHTIVDGNGDGAIDGLPGTKKTIEEHTQLLLGDVSLSTSDAQRAELFDWMTGEDVDKLEDVTALADAGRRFAFHDPLHSSAVALTFGGTKTKPVDKLFVGTNDGGLRAINANTGVEEWIFYPQATLLNQFEVRDNFAGNHIYGMDGNPVVWFNDLNGNGIIEPGTDDNSNGRIDANEGDFVRIFIGMRRGGKNLYALDVTPATALGESDQGDIGDIPPTLMWRIEGGSGDFARLGQTWSAPKITHVRFGAKGIPTPVLIFAGGYDEGQDSSFGPGTEGNAIYLVDPYTGELIYAISNTNHGISNQVYPVPGMDYAIPSDVALMDGDGDGVNDRIIVGDTGGNLWRIDLPADTSADDATVKPVVGKLASVSNNVVDSDKRKFFYQPDIVRVHTGDYTTDGLPYDMIVAVTGNRAHPLSEDVQDRAYAFRDTTLGFMQDADDDGLADSYTAIQGPLDDPAGTITPLLDVTDILDFTDSDNVDDLKAANGWYLDLEATGEKGIAGAPVILDGKMFFNTYLPEGVIDTTNCTIREGESYGYAINVLNGAPAYNFDGLGDDTNYSKDDRHRTLGFGIASQPVPVFTPEGITVLSGVGGGMDNFDPNIGLPRFRTYWYSELER